MSAPTMSLNDLLAVLSLVISILGTMATILAAIFAYQSLKQFQALCKFEKKDVRIQDSPLTSLRS